MFHQLFVWQYSVYAHAWSKLQKLGPLMVRRVLLSKASVQTLIFGLAEDAIAIVLWDCVLNLQCWNWSWWLTQKACWASPLWSLSLTFGEGEQGHKLKQCWQKCSTIRLLQQCHHLKQTRVYDEQTAALRGGVAFLWWVKVLYGRCLCCWFQLDYGECVLHSLQLNCPGNQPSCLCSHWLLASAREKEECVIPKKRCQRQTMHISKKQTVFDNSSNGPVHELITFVMLETESEMLIFVFLILIASYVCCDVLFKNYCFVNEPKYFPNHMVYYWSLSW